MEKKPLKILFTGTPDFAARHLQALLDAHYHICAVLTQPDRPSGRGQKLKYNDVKKIALEHNIPLYQPDTLKDKTIQEELAALNIDVIIDVACGLFLPKEVFEMPKYGTINVHPSLLPRWRGASPIQYAILAGDKETGVTIMQIDEGWDTGPILQQESCPIYDTDTTLDLYERLIKLGIKNLIEVLEKLSFDEVKPKKQDDDLSTYAKKITKQDALIDWTASAVEINRKIRAFNPIPGAYTYLGNSSVIIWQSTPLNTYVEEQPGTIIRLNKESIDVATGEGILRIQRLQLPGRKALPVLDVLNSKRDFFEQNKKFVS